MKLILAFSFIFLSAKLFAEGGVDGGGGDTHGIDYGTAWYLSQTVERPIKVCVQKDTTIFSLDEKIVTDEFSRAMKNWQVYTTRKQIFIDRTEETTERNLLLSPNLNFTFLSKCQGEEDLTLYLGVLNDKIKNILKALDNPVAFSHRESYDAKLGWGKGFIWLKGSTDDYSFLWNKNLNLRGILLHELGHVLGNTHKKNTIMDENIAEILYPMVISSDFPMYAEYQRKMQNIDWEHELYSCLECLTEPVIGSLWITGSREEKKSFNYLMKRDPQGEVISQMKLLIPDLKKRTKVDAKAELTIKDEVGEKVFTIFFKNESVVLREGTTGIFRTYRSFENESSILLDGQLTVAAIYGVMDLGMEKLNVALENEISPLIPLGPSTIYKSELPFTVFALQEGHPIKLFNRLKPLMK